MVDTDTFLTTLYVMVDEFCKCHMMPESHPGPEASLSRSEVVTLAVFSQWNRFQSERDFYRYACRHLRPAFPTLPHREQLNRLTRRHHDAIVAFSLYMAGLMNARCCPYEALDSSGVPVRNCKRRGAGWLCGEADIGWCNRLGWYEGFHLLMAVNPDGIITGFGFGAASATDQAMAECFFALRQYPDVRLASVGLPALGEYVTDKGFEGVQNRRRWLACYGAQIVSAPKRSARKQWPKALRQWLAGIRQIVETVYDKLHNSFRLSRERPHDLRGFQARLAAKVGLHNFCIWLNRHLGRPSLEFAELWDW